MFVKSLLDFVDSGFIEELDVESNNREKRSVVFLGENGCGKSFLINSILRATMADQFMSDEESEFSQPADGTIVRSLPCSP